MTKKGIIAEFKGEYTFLSNFYVHPFECRGDNWLTVEHAFQAAKMDDPLDYFKIRDAKTPGEAKKLGRQGKMRAGWNEERLAVMEELIQAKFKVPALRQMLLGTDINELVEGNWWGDAYWGIDLKKGAGENHLGKILMKVRGQIRAANASAVI